MRLHLPALVFSFSALTSATFYVANQESNSFSIGEAKTIQWDTSDFGDNLDIYLGSEDADEDDDRQGKKIASDCPNSGSFTWTPQKDDNPYKDGKAWKAKVWGKDKKGKKSKGKTLIIIIIINHGGVVSYPGYTQSITKPHPTHVSQTYPYPTTSRWTTTPTLTSITKTTPKYTTEKPPVVTPSQPTYEQPPVPITSTYVGNVTTPTLTASTTRPLLSTNAASISNANPLLAGGLALLFGLL